MQNTCPSSRGAGTPCTAYDGQGFVISACLGIAAVYPRRGISDASDRLALDAAPLEPLEIDGSPRRGPAAPE
jgi:hypothetical protein